MPLILDRLREGALTLTAVGLLAPHLTDANHRSVLDEARHQGKRVIEEIVAHLHPRPDVAASVRKLPTRRASAQEHAAVAQLPPALPAGAARAPAGLLSTALRPGTSRATPADPEGHAPRSSPDQAGGRPSGCASHARPRTIPADVRRSVWARDDGQCTYGGASGRCTERGFLEFHHRVPFAAGGTSTVENVALLCHAHNAMLARQDFPVALEAVVPVETMREGARHTRSTSSGAS